MAQLPAQTAEALQPPVEELGLGIAALSRATGLPIETLRTWERRYGFPVPKHREGTLRLYAFETLDHLRRIRAALEAGHRPSHVVPLPLADLNRLLEGVPQEPPKAEPAPVPQPPQPRRQPQRERRALPAELIAWLQATANLDSVTLDHLLRRSWNTRGSMAFLTELAGPYLEEIGESWARGELSVGHEHFASERLRSFLVGVWTEMGGDGRSGQVVCATLPGEQHVLGLHMAACALVLAGLRVLFLGTEVPLIDLARVVQQARPGQPSVRGLLISVSQAQEEVAVRHQLAQLRKMLPEEMAVLVGGSGAPPNVHGTYYLPDLQSLSQWAARDQAA